MLRLLLSLLSREMVDDRVTALGPVPPAATGRPTPNLLCSSLAFFRVGGATGGIAGASAFVFEGFTTLVCCWGISSGIS